MQNVTAEILLTPGGSFTPNPSACTSHAAPPSPKGDMFQPDQAVLPQQSQGRTSFWLEMLWYELYPALLQALAQQPALGSF